MSSLPSSFERLSQQILETVKAFNEEGLKDGGTDRRTEGRTPRCRGGIKITQNDRLLK